MLIKIKIDLHYKKKTRISTHRVSVFAFNIFSLCFDVIAKYCKRLIKNEQVWLLLIFLVYDLMWWQNHVSSIINEGIRVILNLLIFFLQEDFTRTKSTKTHTSKQKRQFKCAKKHVRGRKSLFRLFTFYAFYVLFVLFCV